MSIHEYYQINFYFNHKEELLIVSIQSFITLFQQQLIAFLSTEINEQWKLEKVAMVFCFYFHTGDESYVKLSTILKQVLLFDTFLHIPKRLSSHLLM